MIVSIRSLSLHPGRFCRCHSAKHVSAQVNSLLALQITAEPSLLWLRSDHRNCSAAHHAAQSLYLSPPAAIDAAGSPLKSHS
jgi:hypothetical protein